jgi:hypothetical protein
MIARKPPGSWYAVLLGSAETPPQTRTLLDTKGHFPAPELGTRCVCCDAETPRRREFDPSGQGIRADPIEIPVCGACETHVAMNASRAGRFGLAGMLGVGLVAFGANRELWIVSLIGGVVLSVVIVLWLRVRTARRTAAADNHHMGFELSVANGMCSIRTTNHRLATELADRHGELVKLAR